MGLVRFLFCRGDEHHLLPLLILSHFIVVRRSFFVASPLVTLCLSLDVIRGEQGIHGLLLRRLDGRDVEKHLRGPQLLLSKLVDEGLKGSSRDECVDSVGVRYTRQVVVLPRQASNVLSKRLSGFLSAALQTPGVSMSGVSMLEVAHECLLEI